MNLEVCGWIRGAVGVNLSGKIGDIFFTEYHIGSYASVQSELFSTNYRNFQR